MKIWRIAADPDRYVSFSSYPTFSFEERQLIDGRPLADGWKTRKLDNIIDGHLPTGDIIGMGAFFLINDAVRQLFIDLGIVGIEYLPFEYQGTIYYLPNVVGTVDCLDRQRSTAVYSPTTEGRILFVNRYWFHEHLIGDNIIFRLKDEPHRMIFVTEAVVSALREAGMKGFFFELIYDGVDDPNRRVSIDGVLAVEY